MARGGPMAFGVDADPELGLESNASSALDTFGLGASVLSWLCCRASRAGAAIEVNEVAAPHCERRFTVMVRSPRPTTSARGSAYSWQ